MITRIVRMTFQEEECLNFEHIFDQSKELIRSFEGCEYLSLHKDHYNRNVYYTLSRWRSQQHLDNYRNSELFQSTWAKTKLLFSENPKAYSLDKLQELP